MPRLQGKQRLSLFMLLCAIGVLALIIIALIAGGIFTYSATTDFIPWFIR